MQFFTRYKAKQSPAIQANDLNARANELERLMKLAVAAPLRLQKAGAGLLLSIDGMRAGGLPGAVPGMITACTAGRNLPSWPEDVRYDAVPLPGYPGPDPAGVQNVIPKYGRPVYGAEVQLHASAPLDACLFIPEQPDLESPPTWQLMVLNEAVAFGPCDPGLAQSTDQPGTSGLNSDTAPDGLARRFARSAAGMLAALAGQAKVRNDMSEGAERYEQTELVADTVDNVSQAIDVSGLSTGTMCFRLVEGTAGSGVFVVEGQAGAGTWTQLPNNENWEEAVTSIGPSAEELRNLDLRAIKRIRVRVQAAADSGAVYTLEFYSKRLRH